MCDYTRVDWFIVNKEWCSGVLICGLPFLLSRCVKALVIVVILKGIIYVRLYEGGLIYRHKRMVQWCPHLRSAISDIEVCWKAHVIVVILMGMKYVRLYEGGLIYRQQRMMQWCTNLRSAISDIKVCWKVHAIVVILKGMMYCDYTRVDWFIVNKEWCSGVLICVQPFLILRCVEKPM